MWSIFTQVSGNIPQTYRLETVNQTSFACMERQTPHSFTFMTIRSTGYFKPVILDTEDTDNYVQAAYVSNRCPGTVLIKRKKVYVDTQALYKENEINYIIKQSNLRGLL